MSNKKAVMALSGGMDSSTVLSKLVHMGYDVTCCHFQYGSKHNVHELPAAIAVAEHYESTLHIVDLSVAFQNISSNLMLSGGDIPEGHYESSNMTQTVIPGRNTIFASVMAGIAESIDASVIALGTHLGDHAVYPDCRVEYIKALDTLIYLASDRKVSVIAPFLETDKIGICTAGLKLGTPYEYTRTCYTTEPIACGRCGACVERNEAFYKNGTVDPVEYADYEFFKTTLGLK